MVEAMRFNRSRRVIIVSVPNIYGPRHKNLQPVKVVALGIELSATRLSAEFGRPALDYLNQSRVPRSRTETLLFPKQACFQLHLYPIVV